MNHAIVSREEWLVARKALLAREKELTRQRDQVNATRLALPWVKLDKAYVFDGPDGKETLSDLFDGRSQLIVQHFMFAPDWDEGCVGCSFGADHIDGANTHLKNHDVTFVAVSRAPLAKLEAYRKRMGWKFKWVSSGDSDFNFDFNVSFTPEQLAGGEVFYNYAMTKPGIEDLPGASAFYRDTDGGVYHTYSNYGRGGEEVLSTYMLLDIAPLGRNEGDVGGNLIGWVRRHDQYPGA